MKLAAAEGLEQGGAGAPFSIVPGVEMPNMLSILATHDINGFVPGIHDILNGYTTPDGTVHPSAAEKMERGRNAIAAFSRFREVRNTDPGEAAKAREELNQNMEYFGYGYLESAEQLVPNVPLVYWSFRIMVGGGGFMILVFLTLVWLQRRGRIEESRPMLWLGVLTVPAAYLAGQAGWVVAEVGRQPWAIQDLLPVNAAVSGLATADVVMTFILFAVLFTLLLVAEIRIMCRAISNAPEITK